MSQAPLYYRALVARIPRLVLRILQNRLELISLELQEETLRLSRVVMLTVVAAILAAAALIGGGALIVAVAPPPARVQTAFIVIGAYLLLSVVIFLLTQLWTRKHRAFAASLNALEKDTTP